MFYAINFCVSNIKATLTEDPSERHAFEWKGREATMVVLAYGVLCMP